MSAKKTIDFIVENTSNPYLKAWFGKSDGFCTSKTLEDIVAYEHGLRLAAVIKKEFEQLPREFIISELEREHGNSLALIIETESQKYELEELKKNLESMTEELKRLSMIDGLTNLANRRHFDNFLELAWRGAIREGQTLSVLMIDVDHFKRYNDHYGHQQGDACLQQIAKALSQFGRRATDLVARYGGEEFVIILSNTSQFHLLRIAEKVRKKIEARNIVYDFSDVADRVTISIGASICIPSRSTSPKALIEAADHALYQAKRGGRNRVQFQTVVKTDG